MTTLSSCLVEERHKHLLVVFLRYPSDSPDTVDSTRKILQLLDHGSLSCSWIIASPDSLRHTLRTQIPSPARVDVPTAHAPLLLVDGQGGGTVLACILAGDRYRAALALAALEGLVSPLLAEKPGAISV